MVFFRNNNVDTDHHVRRPFSGSFHPHMDVTGREPASRNSTV